MYINRNRGRASHGLLYTRREAPIPSRLAFYCPRDPRRDIARARGAVWRRTGWPLGGVHARPCTYRYRQQIYLTCQQTPNVGGQPLETQNRGRQGHGCCCCCCCSLHRILLSPWQPSWIFKKKPSDHSVWGGSIQEPVIRTPSALYHLPRL